MTARSHSPAFARRTLSCAPAAMLFAVAVSGTDAQPPTIRDSAGIRLITNVAPAWTDARRVRLDPQPQLLVGTQDGEPYILSRVAGAAQLGDGRIVIADGASLELRFYDARGTFLEAAAGRGGGPGEVQEMWSLLRLRGDTLALIAGPGVVVYYDSGGTYLRQVNYRTPPPLDLPAGFPTVLAAFADGATVASTVANPAPRGRGDRWIHTIPVAFVDRNKATIRALGELPMSVVVMTDQPQQPWFAPPLSMANNDEMFYVGLGTEYSIRCYTRDGRLVRLIRRRWTPLRVTDADIDTYVVEWGKRWIRTTGAEAERRRQQLRDSPYERTVPAFSQMLVDRVERLWVRSPNLADAPRAGQLNTAPLAPSTWSVFDREGVWLGDVTLPADFRPFDIGGDYVLGIARDVDGVETLVRYGLRAQR